VGSPLGSCGAEVVLGVGVRGVSVLVAQFPAPLKGHACVTGTMKVTGAMR